MERLGLPMACAYWTSPPTPFGLWRAAFASNVRFGWPASRSSNGAKAGGAEGNRTPDPVIANDALYQLSYGPAPEAAL
jgi:hypothetical protein